MSQSLGKPVAGPAAVRTFLERRFFFSMALLMAVVVAYGFHFTVGANLLHPAIPRPTILWVHAATNVTWLGLFIVQTGLVSTRNVAWHKRIGLFGIALGAAVFVVGVSATFAMIRFHAAHPDPNDLAPAFAIVPFTAMALFAGIFGAGVAARWKDREAHRRLMFMATCVLTGAAWGRFPSSIVPDNFFEVPVDALILLGMARDYIVMRRVHPVYLYALPVIVAAQIAEMTIFLAHPAWWLAVVGDIVHG